MEKRNWIIRFRIWVLTKAIKNCQKKLERTIFMQAAYEYELDKILLNIK